MSWAETPPRHGLVRHGMAWYGHLVRLSSESRAPDPTWSTLALAGATGKTNSASTGLLTEQDAPIRVREALAANGSRTPASCLLLACSEIGHV